MDQNPERRKTMNIRRNKKGFTLIELIIIIVILGILAAIAIPKYLDIKEDARKAVASGALGSLAGADNILFANKILNGTGYDFAAVLASVNPSGWTAVAGVITVFPTGGNTYAFTYTANSATSPGVYIKGW
jgi:MSHA pilin protein MshA